MLLDVDTYKDFRDKRFARIWEIVSAIVNAEIKPKPAQPASTIAVPAISVPAAAAASLAAGVVDGQQPPQSVAPET